MINVTCLACNQQIALNPDPKVGQQVVCQSCHADLVVTWLFPICLDYSEFSEQFPAPQDEGAN